MPCSFPGHRFAVRRCRRLYAPAWPRSDPQAPAAAFADVATREHKRQFALGGCSPPLGRKGRVPSAVGMRSRAHSFHTLSMEARMEHRSLRLVTLIVTLAIAASSCTAPSSGTSGSSTPTGGPQVSATTDPVDATPAGRLPTDRVWPTLSGLAGGWIAVDGQQMGRDGPQSTSTLIAALGEPDEGVLPLADAAARVRRRCHCAHRPGCVRRRARIRPGTGRCGAAPGRQGYWSARLRVRQGTA